MIHSVEQCVVILFQQAHKLFSTVLQLHLSCINYNVRDVLRNLLTSSSLCFLTLILIPALLCTPNQRNKH